MKQALLGLLCAGGLVALLAAANLRRDSGATALDWQLLKSPPREVVLEIPAEGLILQTITAPGEVELVKEAKIASQVVGRVVEVLVEEGDRVRGPALEADGRVKELGQALVRLDDRDAKARLDSALARIERLRAGIDQSRSDREKAQRDLARSTQLAGRGAATPTELADARSVMEKADAALAMSLNELRESEAMRASAQQDLEYTVIRAPIDGMVAALDVEEGEVVIAGTTNLPGTVLMTVGDPGRMRVRADVDENDVPLVRPGQRAAVYLLADPTQPVEGSVDLVSPKGIKGAEDVVSFETLVKVEGGEGGPLRPGMTATVEIEVKRAEEALGVPVQAVVHRRRKDLPDTMEIRSWAERNARAPGERAKEAEARYVKVVFVVDAQGKARARPVETGISDERRVEILRGLGREDRVIVGPFRSLDELKDGDPVTESQEKPGAEGARAT